MYTYIHIYIYTYIHKYIYSYIHIYMYTYRHIYICTYTYLYRNCRRAAIELAGARVLCCFGRSGSPCLARSGGSIGGSSGFSSLPDRSWLDSGRFWSISIELGSFLTLDFGAFSRLSRSIVPIRSKKIEEEATSEKP